MKHGELLIRRSAVFENHEESQLTHGTADIHRLVAELESVFPNLKHSLSAERDRVEGEALFPERTASTEGEARTTAVRIFVLSKHVNKTQPECPPLRPGLLWKMIHGGA